MMIGERAYRDFKEMGTAQFLKDYSLPIFLFGILLPCVVLSSCRSNLLPGQENTPKSLIYESIPEQPEQTRMFYDARNIC